MGGAIVDAVHRYQKNKRRNPMSSHSSYAFTFSDPARGVKTVRHSLIRRLVCVDQDVGQSNAQGFQRLGFERFSALFQNLDGLLDRIHQLQLSIASGASILERQQVSGIHRIAQDRGDQAAMHINSLLQFLDTGADRTGQIRLCKPFIHVAFSRLKNLMVQPADHFLSDFRPSEGDPPQPP